MSLRVRRAAHVKEFILLVFLLAILSTRYIALERVGVPDLGYTLCDFLNLLFGELGSRGLWVTPTLGLASQYELQPGFSLL